MGDAAVVAHRLLGCYCCEKTQQERGRDDATGYHNPYGAGDLALTVGGFGLF